MTKPVNPLLTGLFQTYNEAFADAWENLMVGVRPEDLEQSDQDNIIREVRAQVMNWPVEPFGSQGSGLTAETVLNGIADVPAAVELARNAAIYCDDDIPELVKQKLKSFGHPLCEAILGEILAADWESRPGAEDDGEAGRERLIIARMVSLLSEWQYAEGFGRLLDRLSGVSKPDERIAEEIGHFAAGLDPAPINGIMAMLNQGMAQNGEMNLAQEILLTVLADIGRAHPSDDIFLCLKNCFRKMTGKAIGAICLGNYGDGRAIPALRGFLDKNPLIQDRLTIGEIRSAIRKLGGEA